MTGYGAPQPQQRSGQQLPLFDLIGAGLGILSFVWGFLAWYNQKGAPGSAAFKGFFVGGAAAIGLSLLASAVVGVGLLEKSTKTSAVPMAASAAAVLISLGALVSKPQGLDAKIGPILTLITTVVQCGLFVAGWLQAQGKIMSGTPASSAGQWGGGYPQQQQQQQQQQYSQPQYGQQPTQQYGQQPAQQYGQPAPQYGQQPTQQVPAQHYGQPTQHQAPAQPQQTPQGYGQQQPPSNPYGQS
jgi:hypothetical protein